MKNAKELLWPTGLMLAFFLGVLLGARLDADPVSAQQNSYTSRAAEVPFIEGGDRNYAVLKRVHEELQTTNALLREISATDQRIESRLEN